MLLLHCSLPQVMRELKGFLPVKFDPESVEGLSEQEVVEMENVKQIQQSCIRRFFGIEGVNVASPAVFRVATARLLQALDHALFEVCGAGFEQFASRQTAVDHLPPSTQEAVAHHRDGPVRSLTMAADQMSCGPSGITFLQQEGWALFCDLLPDPPHRFWNTEKLGLLQGNAYDAVLLTSIPYCVNDAPWGGCKFLADINEARMQYLALNPDGSCVLFKKLLPLIAQDMKRPSEASSPAFCAEMWSTLSHEHRLRSLGPKPALCRWYSWVDSHAYLVRAPPSAAGFIPLLGVGLRDRQQEH